MSVSKKSCYTNIRDSIIELPNEIKFYWIKYKYDSNKNKIEKGGYIWQTQ